MLGSAVRRPLKSNYILLQIRNLSTSLRIKDSSDVLIVKLWLI